VSSKLDSNLVFSDWKGKLNVCFWKKWGIWACLMLNLGTIFHYYGLFGHMSGRKLFGAFDLAKKVVFFDFVT
jgi:hypothetical protein